MKYKIYISIILLLLTTGCYAKTPQYSQEEVDAMLDSIKGDIGKLLIFFRLGNFETLPQQYAAIVANATEYLLRDTVLNYTNVPGIVEFKHKFRQFLEKYDPLANHQTTNETMNIYFNIMKPYLELPVENITREEKFISNLLDKYNFRENIKKFEIAKQFFHDIRTNGTAEEKLLLFILDNFSVIPQQYSANAANATQYLLKDEALKANERRLVMRFKNNLKMFLKYYNALPRTIEPIFVSMEEFANLTEHYYQLKEEELTEDSKFIIDLLNKYNCGNVAMKFSKHLEIFSSEFVEKFEQNKQDLGKPFHEWFDTFLNYTDYRDRLLLILEFMSIEYENNNNSKLLKLLI